MDRKEETAAGPLKPRLFTKDGKPLRVLSTSLGVALLANALLAPAVFGEGTDNTATANAGSADSGDAPKLVEWSSDAVKAYFDPSVDWNIPLPGSEDDNGQGQDSSGGSGGSGSGSAEGSGGSGGGTTIINTGGGFGWDDLLLYHLLFNRGTTYSSTTWYGGHPSYNPYTGSRYRARSFDSNTFQNKPVVGSAVRPKTSSSSGTITRRSTSSSKGGIGGRSGGFSSSSGSKSSSHGFGG